MNLSCNFLYKLSRKNIIVLIFGFSFQSIVSTVSATPVKLPSKHNVEETVKLYQQALETAKVPVLNEKTFQKQLPGGFSHKGKEIQFSNPFYGWNLGECHRGLRKDIPMTTRVYKDTNGQVWLEYMQPESTINDFGVIECGNETDKVRRALGAFADSATD